MAVVNCHARTTRAAHRSDRLMWFGQLLAQSVGNGTWNARRQINFIESVAIPFEEPDGSTGKTQNLITIRRLHYPEERLNVETLRHDGQLRNPPLKFVDSKKAGRTQHGESVLRMVPEIPIGSEIVKRLKERSHFSCRIFLP